MKNNKNKARKYRIENTEEITKEKKKETRVK